MIFFFPGVQDMAGIFFPEKKIIFVNYMEV